MACYEYKGVKYTEGELIKLLQSQQPKTRRILEVQSDLFQKGRDKKDLTKDTNVPSDLFEDIYIESQTQGWTKEQFEKEKAKLIEEYGLKTKVKSENQFLQLLNKDNNWVTFFIKSIIQDTTKQTITEVQESDVEAKVKELEKEGLLEIDCKGKLKAEKGLQTNFTKGGRWKIYEIFEGKSHKQGGIDINIKNNQISFTNKNGSIKAKYGLVISKDN